MTTYLDVGISRIQQYIGRWPSLRGIRGASGLIVSATSGEYLESVAGGHVVRHGEAGNASGVAHLKLAPEVHPEQAVAAVTEVLRERLPGADLEFRWGSGDDYPSALPHHGDPPDGGALAVWCPAYPFPLVIPCQLCGQLPASGIVPLPSDSGLEDHHACSDCRARDAEAGRRSEAKPAREAAGRRAESDLAAALRPDTALKDATADHFTDLAARGPDPRRANHLATVAIDGNRLGDFFRAVRQSYPDKHSELSQSFDELTFDAVRHATEVVDDGIGVLPVVPHLVGGDDVSISVPALHAWPFVLTFLDRFAAGAREAIGRCAPDLVDRAPTASAGVVFAHATYPFHRTSTLADDLLRSAKSSTQGLTPAIAWHDVTREGETLSTLRMPWPLDKFTKHADRVTGLATNLGKSARSNLARAAAVEDPTLAVAAVHRTVERLGLEVDPEFVRNPDLLADALDLVRWWR